MLWAGFTGYSMTVVVVYKVFVWECMNLEMGWALLVELGECVWGIFNLCYGNRHTHK